MVYVTLAVPLEPPVTTPVVAPMVAEPEPGVILQVPGDGAHVSVVVWPIHTESEPPIADGSAFTVAVVVR